VLRQFRAVIRSNESRRALGWLLNFGAALLLLLVLSVTFSEVISAK